MQFSFSTTEVDTPERFDYWRDVVCKHCIPANSDSAHRSAFDATLSGKTVGPLTYASMASPEHLWERDPRHIRSGPEEGLWVSYMERGTACLEQNGRTVVQKPGDIVLYDASRPFRYRIAPESFHFIGIPRDLILRRTACAERLVATPLGEGTGFGTVLGAFIKELGKSASADAHATAAHLTGSLLDLLAGLLELHDGRDSSRSATEALYERACAYVQEHINDEGLSVEAIARHERVSPRTISRVFAAAGTTPMRYIWQKRLDASYCALAQGSVRKVSELAHDYGFCDLSHFSRAFKKNFGVSPQSVLLRH